VSFNKSEPKLRDWRRHELIKLMQDEGVVGDDGEPITAREASLEIDKVIDTGQWTVQELMDGYKPPKKRFPWRKVFGTVGILLVLLWSAFRFLMRLLDCAHGRKLRVTPIKPARNATLLATKHKITPVKMKRRRRS